MDLKYSFICDYGNADVSGKLNVLGIFTTINARRFPHIHPIMTYIVGMEFHRSEGGHHTFKLLFVDYDGKEVLKPLTGNIEVKANSTNSTNIIVPIFKMKFDKPGIYQFDLLIDDKHFVSNTLTVREIPPVQ